MVLKVVRHILALFLVFLLIQHFAQGDDLPVAPKTLQVVKLPGFIGEHVNDHAAKIQQLPQVLPSVALLGPAWSPPDPSRVASAQSHRGFTWVLRFRCR